MKKVYLGSLLLPQFLSSVQSARDCLTAKWSQNLTKGSAAGEWNTVDKWVYKYKETVCTHYILILHVIT
jgi:hypothetical protein